MEIISEAHVFAEKTGLGTGAMEMLLRENYGPLAYTMSQRLTTGAYEPPRGRNRNIKPINFSILTNAGKQMENHGLISILLLRTSAMVLIVLGKQEQD